MTDPVRGVNATDPLGVASTAQAAPVQPADGTPRSQTAPGVDSADVATVEALLATITKAADAVPPVDQTRVAELQQLINSGAYKANPQQIAKMITDIENLLAPSGKIG